MSVEEKGWRTYKLQYQWHRNVDLVLQTPSVTDTRCNTDGELNGDRLHSYFLHREVLFTCDIFQTFRHPCKGFTFLDQLLFENPVISVQNLPMNICPDAGCKSGGQVTQADFGFVEVGIR